MMLRLLSISLFLASCSHPMPVSGEFFNKTEVIFLEDTLNQPKKFIASGQRVSIFFKVIQMLMPAISMFSQNRL